MSTDSFKLTWTFIVCLCGLAWLCLSLDFWLTFMKVDWNGRHLGIRDCMEIFFRLFFK